MYRDLDAAWDAQAENDYNDETGDPDFCVLKYGENGGVVGHVESLILTYDSSEDPPERFYDVEAIAADLIVDGCDRGEPHRHYADAWFGDEIAEVILKHRYAEPLPAEDF